MAFTFPDDFLPTYKKSIKDLGRMTREEVLVAAQEPLDEVASICGECWLETGSPVCRGFHVEPKNEVDQGQGHLPLSSSDRSPPVQEDHR